MHIFTQKDFQLERDMAISKKMGISLEEYREIKRKEADENRRKAHEEYLKKRVLRKNSFKNGNVEKKNGKTVIGLPY